MGKHYWSKPETLEDAWRLVRSVRGEMINGRQNQLEKEAVLRLADVLELLIEPMIESRSKDAENRPNTTS